MTQEQMKVYQEYKIVSRGLVFIVMKDSNNQLHKLLRITPDARNHIYKPIKNIKGDYNMTIPNASDYQLFIE